MPITIDRKYFENLMDVLENKKHITEEVREQMVKQGKRLIQIDKDKEAGKLNGRPRKIIIIEPVDFHFCNNVILDITKQSTR